MKEGSLKNSIIQIDPEMLRLVSEGLNMDFNSLLSLRLNSASSLDNFLFEIQQILEKSLKQQDFKEEIPCEYYSKLLKEFDLIGWENIASISPNLMAFHILTSDSKGRKHELYVELSTNYPLTPPICMGDIPSATSSNNQSSSNISASSGSNQNNQLLLRWDPTTSNLKEVIAQFAKACDLFDDFWNVLDDLDAYCIVLHPQSPSRAHTFRRISLGSHSSVQLEIDPMKPRMVPQFKFMGADTKIGPLKRLVNKNLRKWNPSLLLRENLEMLLEMTLPSKEQPVKSNKDQKEKMTKENEECAICYSHYLPDEKGGQGIPPDKICDNLLCSRAFHSSCLLMWLQSLSSTRHSFNTYFGTCPYCNETISISTGAPK